MHRRVALIASLLALASVAVPASAAASFAPASACPGAQPGDLTAAADTTVAPSTWGAAPLNVTFTATGADHLEWRLDCGTAQSVAPGTTVGISAADGTHVLSHRAIDGSGMATAWVDDTIGIDSSAPTNTTSSPAAWSQPPVTVNVTGTDLYSGVDHVEWNLDGNGVQTGPSGSTVTITSDGTHSLATQVVDAAGNRSSLRTDTIQVDGTAPTDNTVVPTGWQSTAPTITVTGADALSGVQRVEWKLDGVLSSGANSSTVSIPDGTHSLDTRVIDGAGNASAWASHTVQVDVSGPSDDTTVPSGWQTAPVTVTVTGSDDKSAIDHVEWNLDGVSGSGPNGSAVHVVSDGVHTLQTRIANAAGEISPWRTQYVDVDTLVPNDDTAAPSGWQTAPLTVNVTGDDATSGIQHVEWQIDGGPTQQSTTNGNPVTISAEGQHTLATRVVDAAGLTSAWHNHTVRIDTTAPVNETPVGSSAWRASDYAVVLDGADSGSGLSEMRWQIDGGPVHSGPPLTQVTVSGTGAHTLTTWAVDQAGNASGHRDDPINIDTVPPTDTTSVPSGPVANNSTVAVTGTDAHSGVAQVEWQLDGNPVQTTATAVISGVGTHTLKTQVVDGAGNLSGWTSHTVTVSGTDTTAPTDTSTTIPTSTWYTDPVTVTVAATDADSGVRNVQWRVDGTGLHSGPSGSTATITGDGVHELETRATDNAGNTSAWRIQYVDIDTTLPTDTTALPAGWTNATSFTLDGTDAISGVADVEYELDGATTPSTVAAGGTVTVPGDGTHTIKHRVIDNAGQATAWKTDTVKVDTVKPVNTTGPAPAGWQTQAVQLTLSGTDATSGVDHYEWRVDGGATQTGAQTDVSADGVHTLETRVVDAAGNASDWRSETVQVDTTAPEDTTPTPPAPWQKDPYTVTVSATDATSGLDHVEWRVDGGAVQTTSTATISAPGAHVLETRAVDAAGNASPWRSDPIGIDQTAPTITANCGTGAWVNRPVTCTVTAGDSDSGPPTVTVTRGGGTPQAVNGGTYTVSAEGDWTLSFRAIDGAQNATTAPAATVRVDRTAPQVHVSCVPDAATSYTCSPAATDALSGVASVTYAVDGGPAQVAAGSFTVANGTLVVRAADRAGNLGVAPAVALADRTPPPPPAPAAPKPKPAPKPAPEPVPHPRSRSAAVFGAGGHTRSRLLGELSIAALPTRTTVDVRPLALGSGRFKLELSVKADRMRKTVRKTLRLRHGYSPRIRVRVGGAFSVSVKLTVRRWNGRRWLTYASGSARL